MKVKIEMHPDYKMTMTFEFMASALTLQQSMALTEQIDKINRSKERVPVNLLSFHEINHMWATRNGAHMEPSKMIGELKLLLHAHENVGTFGSTWLTAEIDLDRNEGAINRLSSKACATPGDPNWILREDFVVFPRMQTYVSPESKPRIGEQHPRMQFSGYGPILGLDCVYGVVRQPIMQSIADARYAKKHSNDYRPR